MNKQWVKRVSYEHGWAFLFGVIVGEFMVRLIGQLPFIINAVASIREIVRPTFVFVEDGDEEE